MSGVRLEARVHIVSTPIAAAQNVIKCCQRAGLHVVDLVFAPFAAAEAVLSPEEKELGVAVVEIGAGTTGLLVFADGAVKHTAVLSVGGNHVSSDIAAGLRTPFREAEILKRRYGCGAGRASCRRRRWSRCRRSADARRASCRAVRWRRSSSRALDEIFALVQRQFIRCGLDNGLDLGRRLDRRQRDDGRHCRACRARLPTAGAPRHADGLRRTRRDADEPRLRRCGRPDALRRRSRATTCPGSSTRAPARIASEDAWSGGSRS